MERFCAGDQKAFDALFERHAGALHGYLTRMIGDRATADDLLQTTFLSVVRARGRFEKGARVTPWLYAIAANAARDTLRRRKFRAGATEQLRNESPDSDEAALRDHGLEKRMQAALASLPASQREAVVMHHLQELPFEEVAAALGISVSAAKVRAHRGYERLRALLADLKDGGP